MIPNHQFSYANINSNYIEYQQNMNFDFNNNTAYDVHPIDTQPNKKLYHDYHDYNCKTSKSGTTKISALKNSKNVGDSQPKFVVENSNIDKKISKFPSVSFMYKNSGLYSPQNIQSRPK